MEPYLIEGIELKIDASIQQVCETSNTTSSSTRSVLYVLLLVSILCIISVLNSFNFNSSFLNWTSSRINENTKQIVNDIDAIATSRAKKNLSYFDSVAPYYNLETMKKRLENNLKNEMENVDLVRIPVLGNSFDINDLGLISGIAFFVLLTIARFTLSRERNNLKIALKSITDRYIDTANEGDFKGFIKGYLNLYTTATEEWTLYSINHTRRQHHYNYLSMNAIFTLPPLEINKGNQMTTIAGKCLMKIFWFPFFVYLLICLVDMSSFSEGFGMNEISTIISFSGEVLFIIIIFITSLKCTAQKKEIYNLYNKFKNNKYKYIS